MSTMLALPLTVALPAAAAVLVSSGCADRLTDPGPARASASARRADAVQIGEATASVRWSAITRDFIAAKPAAVKPSPVAALRAFAYLSLAQYRAVVAPEEARGRPPHASPQGAVAAASAVVLSALFPADAAPLAAMADEAGESRLYAGIHYRFDKDAALGIARQVADLALSRGVDDAHGWPGER